MMKRTSDEPASEGAPMTSAEQILALPRLARIAMVMGFSVAVTFLVMPLADGLYLTLFFNETTVLVPALVAASAGLVMYLAGWRVMVGTVGEPPVLRPIVAGYVLFGTLIIVMVVTLFIIGTVIGVEQ